MESLQKIDHSAMTVNQVIVIALNILAFVLNLPWLAALVAAVMLLGTLLGRPGFGFIYQALLKPTGWVRPHVLLDNPEPHRFAQGLGGVFMLGGALALFSELGVLGWGLVWMVAALAALNAFGGFCVGCFVYYWLTRLGIPGFSKNPPTGTFPGMRPKGAVSDER
ncbi:MAG: DUF4395 domain-containing protein [Anaerolineales bacterium]